MQREVLAVILFICLLFFSGASIAEEQVFDIEIPAQDAASSLEMLAEQTGAITLFPYDVASSAQANAVKGRYTLEDALSVLLKDSGLLAGLSNQRVITIEEMMKAPNEKEEQAMLKPPSKTSKVLAFISSLIVGGGSAAHESTKPEDHLLEELVVTARMKEETLLTTPVSMSVFDSTDMWDAGITSVVDLAEQTPGFQIENDLGRRSQRPVMRGIENSRPQADQPVSIYVDGFYTRSGIYSSISEAIERVEILKGPQASLYGRPGNGGVINYISKRPEAEPSGSLTTSFAEHENIEIDGYFSGAFSNAVRASLGVHHYQYGGEYNNLSLSVDGARKIGSEETNAVHGALFVNPTEQLEIVLRAYHAEDKDGQYAAQYQNKFSTASYPCTSGFSSFCGVVRSPGNINITTSLPVGTLLGVSDDGPLLSAWDFKAGLDRDISRLATSVKYDFANDVTIEWLGAYTKEDIKDVSNQSYSARLLLDYEPDDMFITSTVQDEESQLEYFSNEVRLTGRVASINWMAGIFSYEEERDIRIRDLLNTSPIYLVETTQLSELSLFAGLDWEITEYLSLGLEARLTDEVRSRTRFIMPNDVENQSVNPRLTVDYQWSKNTLLYSSISRGEKLLGTSLQIGGGSSFNFAFGKEVVDQFEAGVKSTFAGGHMRIQLAAFWLKQNEQEVSKNFFLPFVSPYFQIATDGKNFPNETEILGVEFEYEWLINDHWFTSFSYALSDSEFVDGDGVGRLLKGLQRPRVPEHAVNVMVQYSYPLGNKWTSKTRLDAIYNSSRQGETDNGIETGDEFELNARTSLSKDNVEVSLWIDNALDEKIPTNAIQSNSFNFGENGYVTFLPRGRQAGVSLKYSF